MSPEPLSSAVAQRAIQARCQHPAGRWTPWDPADVEQPIGQRFEQQVARHADRVALRTPGLDLTYTALNLRANRIARALLEHMDVVILDEDGQPVPPDAPGELAVRSRYTATGYWQRSDLTAARFVSDPSGSDARVLPDR